MGIKNTFVLYFFNMSNNAFYNMFSESGYMAHFFKMVFAHSLPKPMFTEFIQSFMDR